MSYRVVTFRALCALLLSALGALSAVAGETSVSGRFVDGDQVVVPVDAYAYRKPDPFEEGSQVTVVVLADKAFDRAALDAAPERDSAIRSFMFEHEARLIELTLDAEGEVSNLYVYVPPGSNLSMSGSGETEVRAHAPTRTEGRFVLEGEERQADLAWAVDVAGDPVPLAQRGSPLPAGGGEPGAAYVAYIAAVRSGDPEKMAAHMGREMAEAMLSHRGDPDFAEQIELFQAFNPSEITVTGGRLDGETAYLDVVGKDADGRRVSGTVTMGREGGRWIRQDDELAPTED